MVCYIISYDLVKQRNYQNLFDAIKSYGTWAHIMESTWAVLSDKTAVQVRDHLAQHIDQDDKLFVVKSGGEGAWTHLPDDVAQWLKDNLRN